MAVRIGCAVAVLIGLLPHGLAAQVALGCYDVSAGSWSPIPGETEAPAAARAPDQHADSVFYAVPPRLRLDSQPARPAGGRQVTVPENSLQVPHSWRSWRERGDTLFIVFSTGFVGSRLQLRPSRPGRYAGEARSFTDVGGSRQYRRPAELTRVDCDSPPPIPASRDEVLPRSVRLTDGSMLELGRPIPDGIQVLPRRTGAWTAMVEAGGLWAGHDTVVVRLTEDRVVHHIEFRWPRGHDILPLLDSIAAIYPPDRTTGGRPSWSNRTTRIFASSGGRPRIVFRDPRYF